MARIIHLTTPGQRKTLALEGNELVIYTRQVDETKPVMWLDGCCYQFNSNLAAVQRVPAKRLVSLVDLHL